MISLGNIALSLKDRVYVFKVRLQCLFFTLRILKTIQWHIHAGLWSLVNCWREALTWHYIRCSWILIRMGVGLTAGLGLDGDRCIRVIPWQWWKLNQQKIQKNEPIENLHLWFSECRQKWNISIGHYAKIKKWLQFLKYESYRKN